MNKINTKIMKKPVIIEWNDGHTIKGKLKYSELIQAISYIGMVTDHDTYITKITITNN